MIDLEEQHSFPHRDYRKKKLGRTNTRHDDFVFSDARQDAIEVLSTVAIARRIGVDDPLPERIFAAYRAGGWPCGTSGTDLFVFNPRVLGN
jgi:hypothetical protein